MIPVLFKGNETNFNHNGIGLLKDTLSCEVSEVRNGSFDLELVYPITGSYFKDLKNGNIIQAKPNDTDQPHNFRITEIDKTLSDKEVVVYGVSITNDLGGNMVKSLYLEDVTPQVVLNEMKNTLHYPTTFNFVSNITTIGWVDWELNNPLNLIVGEEGSLVDIFGGEVKRTNDTLFLYGRRGKDNVTTIRAGKNLDGFKMTESFQGKYTQILPYFKYEEEVPGEIAGDTEGETIRQEVTVFGSIVSSPYHGRYPVNVIKPVDFSQNETVREAKTLKALNAEAARYFSDLYSEIDKPSVNINVDMIQLVDSEQYELYEKLEKIELTDTVSVYVPEYDVDVLVKITELKYDSLRERTISIVAGSSGRTSLMDEISGSYKQFTTTLVDDKIQSATSGIINQILTKKDGGNVYAGRVTPPDNAKLGDIWFKDTGGGDVELYEFDGVNWVRKMYKGFGDDVRQLVDDKIAESNALFTGALDEQAEAVEQANALAQLAKTIATDARTELLGRVDTLDSKATDLKTQADNISGQLNTLSNETGTKFQNQSKIITDIQGTLSEYSSTIQDIDGKVTNNTTQLTQQATQIASKVSQTDFNAEKTKITNLQTSVTQQAGQIALKAEKTYVDTVKQTVDSHTTSITQQADQIALKANQTDYNNLTGRMSTAESSITQNATEISKRLTSTQVDQAILANKRIKDTRRDNQSPQWYRTNYPKQTVEEFKESSVIGLTGEGTYAILTTNVPLTDLSGGNIKQTAKTDRATFERYGTGTTWDPWIKIANSSDLANYTTKTEFQTVKETTSLYERVIGSTEVDVKDKIARIVMTDSSFVTEVAKFGEHNNNLIVDATNHSQTEATGGASLARYPLQNRIDFSRSGATTNVYAGISCKLHSSRIIAGEKYTLSFDYYLHYSAPDSNLMIELKDGSSTLGAGNVFASPTTPTGVWHKHTDTIVSVNNSTPGSNNIRLLIHVEKNASVAIRNIMLVRGEKIGPFSTSQVDVVSTRVEQTANSYSIKFLNNANDITTQLNLTNSGARIKSSLIHLDGNVTISGTAWMDGAVIKNMSADKITTGTLNANNVNITNLSVDKVSGITATYLQSVIGTAFIDWMKGKTIQGYNNNMTIDLLGGNIILNSGSNAIKRVKGTHTAFVHFNDVSSSADGGVGSIYASIGVTSSGDGVDSMSSGRFAGLRAFRAASGTAHTSTIDQTEIYGDTVVVKDSFTVSRGFLIRPVTLDRQYDLNDDVLNPIRFFVRLLLHLNNIGWNWQNGAFLDALLNEWNAYGMSRYGTFRNNTIYHP